MKISGSQGRFRPFVMSFKGSRTTIILPGYIFNGRRCGNRTPLLVPKTRVQNHYTSPSKYISIY